MIDFSDLNVEAVENDGRKGVFKIGPLPKGYGNTLANSLRRILLSSMEGAGITSLRVSGADHEYTALEGVKETVMEIMMNLKGIRFSCSSDEPQTVKVSVKGPKTILADDLELTESVSVMDPKSKIATVTGKGKKFDMELVVEKGVGYRFGDEGVRAEAGRLPLDAKFSPILRVMYNIEETRKGGKMDLDMITISVFSDGSIDPKAAVSKSMKILMNLSERVMFLTSDEKPAKGKSASGKKKKDKRESGKVGDVKLLIEDLDLTTRTKAALVRGGINNVEELVGKTEDELSQLKGFGKKAMDEILDYIEENKLGLKK